MKLQSNHLYKSIKKNLASILNLVYPPVCLICDKSLEADQNQICDSCLTQFQFQGKIHSEFSVPGEIHLGTAWPLFKYDTAFQKLIHHLKYSQRRKPIIVTLQHFKNEILAQLSPHHYDYVISIPLHPRKLRERGYNQVDDMSRWLATELGIKFAGNLVKRTRYTNTQTQLNAEERLKNVSDAFAVARESGVAGKHVLLVDDVLTTGATANSLAQVLKAAGASKIDLVTLSTPDHGNT